MPLYLRARSFLPSVPSADEPTYDELEIVDNVHRGKSAFIGKASLAAEEIKGSVDEGTTERRKQNRKSSHRAHGDHRGHGGELKNSPLNDMLVVKRA